MSRHFSWWLIWIWGAILVIPAARAQLPTSGLTENTLSVVVMGQATGTPDQVLITLDLTAPAPSFLEGFQEIRDQIEALRTDLENAQIPAEAITVEGPLFVTPLAFPFPQPQRLGFQPPEPQPQGGGKHQAKATVRATLPASPEDPEGTLGRLDEVLRSLEQAGRAAPQVTFTLSDPGALEATLMQNAIAKAKPQAAALAAALGAQVGPVEAAQAMDMAEIMGGYMQSVFAAMGPLMQMMGGMLGGGEPINPQEVTISRLVVVSFQMVRSD